MEDNATVSSVVSLTGGHDGVAWYLGFLVPQRRSSGELLSGCALRQNLFDHTSTDIGELLVTARV